MCDEHISRTETLVPLQAAEVAAPRKFLPRSTILAYLMEKFPDGRFSPGVSYSMSYILRNIKRIITIEKMYDEANKRAIIGDPDFERAFNCKSCNASHLRNLVSEQLTPIEIGACTLEAEEEREKDKWSVRRFNDEFVPKSIRSFGKPDDLFVVKPDFLRCLGAAMEIDPEKETYTYSEITRMFSDFLARQHKKLCDPKNPNMILCENTFLGKVTGFRAFARHQASIVLIKQVTRYNNNKKESK